MRDLPDRFCPNVHDAPITTACFDPSTGFIATADATGLVAVQRRGESWPGLVFRPAGMIDGALAIGANGTLLAIGDTQGFVGVYRTDNGQEVFSDRPQTESRGLQRAMQGIALNAVGTLCATIAVDGVLRIWDLTRKVRLVSWKGFGGVTVDFDPRSERVLCLDDSGQPVPVELDTRRTMQMDHLQMPADRALFTRDGTRIVAMGPAGLSVLRIADGQIIASFATHGGSGLRNLAFSPDGAQVAALTQRSVHVFDVGDLRAIESFKHGKPDLTGAILWSQQGIRVAGADGLMQGSGTGSLGPITASSGLGVHRCLAHGNQVAIWEKNRRKGILPLPAPARAMDLDREGRLLAVLLEEGPIQVYDLHRNCLVFEGGRETSRARSVSVGGHVVMITMSGGGIRWWQLQQNQAYDLAWPRTAILSGSGTWIGVVTPRGAVRIINPVTGIDTVHPPQATAEVPARLLAFMNRAAGLLVLDDEGVLSHFDLAAGIRQDAPTTGRDLLEIKSPIDQIWGITGGRHCVLKVPEGETCSLMVLDINSGDVIKEIPGLHPSARVDEESGMIMEPARSSALLERDLQGEEQLVLRSLPNGEWISFTPRGVQEMSPGATAAIGR